MSYVLIGDALATMLGEITQIKVVNNYATSEFEDFPAANIRMVGHNNTFATTAANNRVYVFAIDIFYKTQVPQDAEAILRDIADRVILKIESDVTLRGSAHIARPSRGDVARIPEPIPMQYITVTIEASKHINR